MRFWSSLPLAFSFSISACGSAHEPSPPALATPQQGSADRREQAPMKSAKEETEDVLNALVPAAKHLLEQHGEFFPIGAAMLRDGSIVLLAYKDQGEHPASQTVIDGLLDGARTAAKLGTYRAVGIAYAITTIRPGAAEKTDAINVRLDHVSGYSVQVIFPYKIPHPGEVLLEDPFATPGLGGVFPSP